MESTNAPACFRRARREILMAIESANAEDALEHEQAAHDYMIEAVREIRRAPEASHDWGALRAHQDA